MSVFFGENTAPGSGRVIEIQWAPELDTNITPGTSLVTGTSVAKGGANAQGNIWTITNTTGTAKWEIVNNCAVGLFGDGSGGAQGAQFNLRIPDIMSQLGIDSPTAMQSWQQIVYEIEVIASAAPGLNPVNYGAAFWLTNGNGIPTNGPGSTDAQGSVGWGLDGANAGSWVPFIAQPTSAPTLLAAPTVNALRMNKLALQVLRASKSQPPAVQFWLNDSKILTQALNVPPFFPRVGGSVQLVCNIKSTTGTPSPGQPIGIRAARVIAGPIDPSVYPT